jgi:hypothetical protein
MGEHKIILVQKKIVQNYFSSWTHCQIFLDSPLITPEVGMVMKKASGGDSPL